MKKKIIISMLGAVIFLVSISTVIVFAGEKSKTDNAETNAISEAITNKNEFVATSDEYPYVVPGGNLVAKNDTSDISNLTITIVESAIIEITADGQTISYNVPVDTVENTLDYLDIKLSDDDLINVDLSSKVYDNEQIVIQRVEYKEYTKNESVPYSIKEVKSDNLLIGETEVSQKGQDGKKAITYQETYIDGSYCGCTTVKTEVISEPVEEILSVGTQKIIVVQSAYDNSNNVLIRTSEDDENFSLPSVELSDDDRDLLERLLTGEFGSSYVGACLVAQAVKCAIANDGYTSIESLIKGMGYTGSTESGKSQNAVDAVKFIFDENGLAVKHRLFYMCTEDYYDSNPDNFHSTQHFILQFENVKFFDRW